MADTQKKPRQMERSINTILLGVITAGFLYFGNAVVSTANDVGIIKFQVGEIIKNESGYVTRAEIDLRSKDRDDKMSALSARIENLEDSARGMPHSGQ